MAAQTIKFSVEQPYDWLAMLRFFAARAIPGVDEVEGSVYRRAYDIGGIWQGYFSIGPTKTGLAAEVEGFEVKFPKALDRNPLRIPLDLDAPGKHIAKLLSRDERLKPAVEKRPGLRVPGTWDRFELGVRAILGQQVSVAAASTLAGRIATKFGKPTTKGHATLTRLFPKPGDLADANLSGLGLTTRRAATITNFARALTDNPALLTTGRSLDSFVECVSDLPGFGPWTAHYMAMRMGYPDAFPASDLGVRKALNTTSDKEVLRLAERWRPYRAYATMHLWASLSD